jgi:asparagine synthase (glutamine-hydrolysing)
MCGICGKINFDSNAPVDPAALRSMMDSMAHRGPDEDGVHLSRNAGLGHKRLCIIDLTSGQQPMANEDESIWIIFNGEIYNYKELQKFLLSKGHRLRTASDTEVIVHLYEEFGEECVGKLQGMFTFALWDRNKGELLLARDRVGIKPLYYCVTGDALLFGSEVKAILAEGSVQVQLNPAALDTFLTFGYVPGDETLFRGVEKLPPGHYLTVRNGAVKVKQYWDLQMPEAKRTQTFEENVEALRELLGKSVRDHMISDVPVGILLSGGVDSTAVLSYAVEAAGQPLSTFTIGFGEHDGADERLPARLVAKQFGTHHYETTITSGDFADWLPSYVWHMEEPVCEPPAVALYFVSKLARKHVTVLLSGEGGDEAFAGYSTYRNIAWLERLKRLLGPLRLPASGMAKLLGGLAGNKQLQHYAPLMAMPLEEYYYSRSSDPLAFFNQNRAALYSPDFLAQIHSNGDAKLSEKLMMSLGSVDALSKMLYVDTKTWLPDDLLVKADKVTMANSVELRVPLLDHHVLEFAASVPSSHKLSGFRTKHVLKQAIANRVPKAILERPKTGFPVPYDRWLRSDLKAFTADVLMDSRTTARGYFNRGLVEQVLRENSPERNRSKEIFSLLVLELWHRAFIDRAPVGAGRGGLTPSVTATV